MPTNAQLLNEAGTKLSAMNDFLAKALQTADAVTAASIQNALALLGPAGKALGAVADAVLGKADTPNAATLIAGNNLKPGQVVGDVGSGDEAAWTGPISPTSPPMTKEDWLVFMQNYERMPMFRIFNASPAGKEVDPETGRNLQQGDAASNPIDVAAYKAKGGLLAPWL